MRHVKAIRITGRGDNTFTTGTPGNRDLTSSTFLDESGKKPRYYYCAVTDDTNIANNQGVAVKLVNTGDATSAGDLRELGLSIYRGDPIILDVQGHDELRVVSVLGGGTTQFFMVPVEVVFE